MGQGVLIHDIGPDPFKTSLGPFYSMELQAVDGLSESLAGVGVLLMHASGTDNKDTVEKALAEYRQWAREIAPYVQAALARKIQVPQQTVSAEVWLIFALYWEQTNKTLENLVRDADVVGHSLPSGAEIAWTLLRLRDRGWLFTKGDLYGITAEGLEVLQSIVGKSGFRETYQRLEEWVSAETSAHG